MVTCFLFVLKGACSSSSRGLSDQRDERSEFTNALCLLRRGEKRLLQNRGDLQPGGSTRRGCPSMKLARSRFSTLATVAEEARRMTCW